MQTFKLTCFVAVILLFTSLGCTNNTPDPEENQKPDQSATSQNSLDWGGTYHGELPCADCTYIRTSLSLNSDHSYVLTKEYIGKEEKLRDTLRGKFNWIDGMFVELEGIPKSEQASRYKVEENRIRQMDLEGQQIKGELADKYILYKE